jgi:hypothetical protein
MFRSSWLSAEDSQSTHRRPAAWLWLVSAAVLMSCAGDPANVPTASGSVATTSGDSEPVESTVRSSGAARAEKPAAVTDPGSTDGGRHEFHPIVGGPAIHLDASQPWEQFASWGLRRGGDEPDWIGITFWSVDQLYGHPCQWQGTQFDPGDTVEDLAAAIREVPLRNATTPAPVTVDGANGLYLEWTVPVDLDFDSCDNGWVESWTGNGAATDRYQQMPGQLDRLWILDVDGRRLVIDATYHIETDATARPEVDEVVASIDFNS